LLDLITLGKEVSMKILIDLLDNIFKKTDFATLMKKDMHNVKYLLNTKPRKIMLNFNNPIEEFYQHTGQDLKYALAC